MFEVTLLTWDRRFCLRHPEVRDVCDIGQYLFWNSRIVWYLTAIMFLLNNTVIQVLVDIFFFLSAHLLIVLYRVCTF